MEYNGSAWPKIQPPQPDPLLVHPYRTSLSLPPHPHHHHYVSVPYYYPDQSRPTTLPSSTISSYPYYHSPGADTATAVVPSVYAPSVHYEGFASTAAGQPTVQDPPARYESYASASYSYPSAVGMVGAADYYGVGADSRSFSVKEAIQQYGTDPIAHTRIVLPAQYGHSNEFDGVVTHLNHGQKTNMNHHFAIMKGARGMSKIVQSAYCEVCKIDCNSQEVLKSHKFGKKHKKNLEKLRESIALKPQNVVEATAGCSKGDKKNPIVMKTLSCKIEQVISETTEVNRNNQKRKKNAPATAADLEIKKQKVLDGGAPADGVRICTICNVVCNSELVFNYHMAGQKHAAMVKYQKNND